jgi:hypothetical protein
MVRSSQSRIRTVRGGSGWFSAVAGLAHGEAQSMVMHGALDSAACR